MPSRKRERSKTPEIAWELLPSAPTLSTSSSKPKQQQEPPPAPAKKAAPAEGHRNGEADLEQDLLAERQAWRRLVILLAALKGDPKTEELLRERAPELVHVADSCGATGKAQVSLTQAKESARSWFAGGLRGSNQHGPAARALLCNKLAAPLSERMAELCREASSGSSRVAEVLDRGRAEEEGPLICSLMTRDLQGSRYEGLWISRKGPAGHYYLGDELEGAELPDTDKDGDPIHPRVHAVVKIIKDTPVISGFYLDPDDDTMSPAKVPIGPFLSVYFEGMAVRDASAAWKNGPPPRPARKQPPVMSAPPAPSPPVVAASVQRSAVPAPAAAAVIHQDASLRALQAGLPPGWEVRESRSKKGVYYFANPSKGLSQLERPRI